MPITLDIRRDRHFRPINLSDRHRLVAMMRALGRQRSEIAAATGYSVSHVSRIAHMPAVRKEVAHLIANLAESLIARRLEEMRKEGTFV